MENLYIVIPAYNEEENISTVARKWHQIVEKISSDSRLVIVNDGSKDHTLEILKKLQKELSQLVILTKPNGGHGAAVLYGYRYALKHNADYIFQTDSDGQTDTNEFEQFWEKREEYDAVLGNRVVREDGKDRKFVENTVCFLLRMIFGVKVKDANAPYRLMQKDLVARYINRLPEDFNIPNIMFTTYFKYG